MRILFADDTDISLNGDIDFSGLEALGEYHSLPNGSVAEIIEHSAATEVIVVNKALITTAVFEALADLRLVAVSATGYNNVDLEAARAAGVTVSNVAGYAGDTVPQHAFALILNLATKAYRYAADVARGDWQRSSSFTLLRYPAFELKGLTIGIIGFGVIGRGVARIAEGFGMRILAHDAFPIHDSPYANTPLDELLAESDFVTIHSPLTDQTAQPDRRRGTGADEAHRLPGQHGARRHRRRSGAGRGTARREPGRGRLRRAHGGAAQRRQPAAGGAQHHHHPAQRVVHPRGTPEADRRERGEHPRLHRRHPAQRGQRLAYTHNRFSVSSSSTGSSSVTSSTVVAATMRSARACAAASSMPEMAACTAGR